jgi:hypothetical protein
MNELLRQLYLRHGLDPTAENEAALRAAVAREKTANRAGQMTPRTVDAEARSVEAVVATEEPAEVWDYERWAPVDEILLMKGARLSKVRKGRLPLLDAHQRDTARRVLGSVTDLRVDGPELIGTEVYSAISEPEFVKVTEGHLDQRSVGYRVFATTYIKPGESATVEGRTFAAKPNKGLSVVTDWIPVECSVVPIGADPASGTRADVTETPETPKEPPTMPADTPKIEERAAPVTPPVIVVDPAVAAMRAELDALKTTVAKDANARAIDDVFRASLHLPGVDALRTAAIQGNHSADQARATLLAHLQAQTSPAGRVAVTADEADKRRECAIHAIYQRANPGAKATAEEQSKARQFRGMSLLDLARHCLEAAGQSTRGMDQMEIAGRAFQTTPDYPHILSSTANKTLLAAYDAAPRQWARWCKRGSLSDFKATPRVRMSASGILPSVPEGAEFPNYSVTDTAENIQLATFGKIFAISRQAVINDDMDAFGSIPTAHALAWARTVNQAPVRVIMANAALHDGVTLYYATTHSNITTTTTVTTKATAEASIRAMRALMTAQYEGTAENKVFLQIVPAFLLVTPTKALYFVQAVYETGVSSNNRLVDIARLGLEVIEEPELENDALTGYATDNTYMFAAPGACPTVEVAFLNGNDAPTLETQTGFEVDGIKLKVRGDVAAKAIDWRGTAMHNP